MTSLFQPLPGTIESLEFLICNQSRCQALPLSCLEHVFIYEPLRYRTLNHYVTHPLRPHFQRKVLHFSYGIVDGAEKENLQLALLALS